jgi:hypothetical protein
MREIHRAGTQVGRKFSFVAAMARKISLGFSQSRRQQAREPALFSSMTATRQLWSQPLAGSRACTTDSRCRAAINNGIRIGKPSTYGWWSLRHHCKHIGGYSGLETTIKLFRSAAVPPLSRSLDPRESRSSPAARFRTKVMHRTVGKSVDMPVDRSQLCAVSLAVGQISTAGSRRLAAPIFDRVLVDEPVRPFHHVVPVPASFTPAMYSDTVKGGSDRGVDVRAH